MAGSPESTAAASSHYAVAGYDSVEQLVERDEIDLIAITVRVPEHRRLLGPVLESGKAILCEWPLALDLTEAEFLRDSGCPGPRFTGLQGHASPTIAWIRDLIADGYVGEVRSSSILCSFPGGGPTFTSASAYTADAANGATMMTIPFAHTLDMQTVLLGELTNTTATIATQRTEALNTDTATMIPKTAPDQIAVTGRLPGGAVASMHFRAGARRTTPFLWEIDGTGGSLRITGGLGLPMSVALTVEGATDQQTMTQLELPAGYDQFPALAGTPAHNVAHLYARIVDVLSGKTLDTPTFEYAVELHRSLQQITDSAEQTHRPYPFT